MRELPFKSNLKISTEKFSSEALPLSVQLGERSVPKWCCWDDIYHVKQKWDGGRLPCLHCPHLELSQRPVSLPCRNSTYVLLYHTVPYMYCTYSVMCVLSGELHHATKCAATELLCHIKSLTEFSYLVILVHKCQLPVCITQYQLYNPTKLG